MNDFLNLIMQAKVPTEEEAAIKRSMSNWAHFSVTLATLDEPQCLFALGYELKTAKREHILTRIHQRYKRLTSDNQKKAILYAIAK